jgi:hypothetical protein
MSVGVTVALVGLPIIPVEGGAGSVGCKNNANSVTNGTDNPDAIAVKPKGKKNCLNFFPHQKYVVYVHCGYSTKRTLI